MNTKKGKSTPNKIDQKMFDCIKILIASGQNAQQIKDYLGISPYTTYRIKQAETLQEYKNIIAEISLQNRQRRNTSTATKEEKKQEPEVQNQAQIVEHRQSVTVQTTYYVNQKLDKITELLTGISAKLAFVVDELTGSKPKERSEADE